MPTTAARLRLLAWAGIVVVVAALVALALVPGTAVAALMESPSPTPEPTAEPTPTQTPPCIPPVAGCPPIPSAAPTVTPTRTATPTPSATRSPTPSPTRAATKSPKPAPQPVDDGIDDGGGSLDDPVTGGGVLGTLSPWTESPSAAVTPSTQEAAGASESGDDALTRIITLVLGLGVLLGLAGGTGLYVTRHRHEH